MASSNSRITPPQAAANVRVLVRIRPLNKSEVDFGSIGRTNVLTVKSACDGKIDFRNGESPSTDATITVNSGAVDEASGARRRMTGLGSNGGSTADGDNNSTAKHFTADAVHGQRSSQADVYDSVKEIVNAVASGYNGTIVAYGQTGSGKTHTVFGQGGGDESEIGLVQRSLRDIFHKVTLSQAKAAGSVESVGTGTTTTTFKSSFFEIFNERVYDLLCSDSLESNLAVREDANRVYVEGLKEIEVTNTTEAENVLAQGMANRHTAATNMNRTSSRSHAVFALSVKSEHVDPEGLRKIRNSKFTLVDLAGSERQKSTAALGDRLKEASMINKSLLCLGHVINAVVDREAGRVRHIPFRNSKLTFLLRDTWGGNSKTCLVATVSPSGKSLAETISTLQFAQRAKLIKNNAVLNEDTCGTVAALQAEVTKLRSQLERSSATPSNSNENISLHEDQHELIGTLKRRAHRAEDRALCLEKQVSEEDKVVQTLKRKVREEIMVRKFKERRINYLQTSSKENPRNKDEHRMMSDEISCLQKRLETPSIQAIEWKLAYEQVKETLDSQIENDGMDAVTSQDKIQELDSIIERLCGEKVALEERVSNLTLSSSDTQDEIDSILKEVNRLETEMIALQDEVVHQKDRVITLEKEAVIEKDMNNELQCDLRNSNDNALKHEMDFLRLQKSSCNLSEELETLSERLKNKSEQIVEMEMLSKEIESELQVSIDGLGSKLNECKKALVNKESAQLDLEGQLSSITKTNLDLNEQIEEAFSQIQAQNSIVVSVEDKISLMQTEKDAVIANLRSQNEEKRNTLVKETKSLQEGMKHVSEERNRLKSEICTIRDEVNIAGVTINEKEAIITQMMTKVEEMKGSVGEADQVARLEKDAFEDKISTQKVIMEGMKGELEMLTEEKRKALCEAKEDKEKIEITLQKEVEEMRAKSDHWNGEKMNLENNLAKAESNTENHRILLQKTQTAFKEAQAERNMAHEITTNEQKQIEKELQDKIQQIKVDHNQMKLECANSKQLLYESKAESEKAVESSNNKQILVVSLREQLSILEEEKNASSSHINAKIQALDNQVKDMWKEKSELETSLRNNIGVLSLTTKALNDQKELLTQQKKNVLLLENDHKKEIQNDFEAKEAIRISHKREVKCLNLKISELDEKGKLMDVELLQCRRDSNTSADNFHNQMEKKTSALESQLEKYRALSEVNIAEIQSKISCIQNLEEEVKSLQLEKELNIQAEKTVKALQSEHLFLKNRADRCSVSEEDAKRDLLLQKDRFTLLNRKKDSIESELKVLQYDQDALNNQIGVLDTQNKELGAENRRLICRIEDMNKAHSNSECMSSNTTVEIPPSSCSMQESPAPFYDLSTKMDNMLEKMSTDQSTVMDDTFDESMFLPNAGVDSPDDKENKCVYSNTPSKTKNEKPKSYGLTPLRMSTPSKLEYSVKRLPLSEKKIRTPLKMKENTPKRAVTSNRKHAKGLSATKIRSNWMLFDNKTLFRNEKKCD